MKGKKRGLLLGACVGLLSLCSCTARPEISEMLIISGAGIDYTQDGVQLSVQAQHAEADSASVFLQTEAATVSEAMDLLTEETGKVVVTSQTMVLVVGQSGITQTHIGSLYNAACELQLRPDVLVLLAEEEAGALLGARDEQGNLLPVDDLQSICKNGLRNGKGLPVRLMDWYNEFYGEAGNASLPQIGYRQEGGWLYQGMQLFDKEGRKALWLSDQETALYAAITGKNDTFLYTLPQKEASSVQLSLTGSTDLQPGESLLLNVNIQGYYTARGQMPDEEDVNRLIQQDCEALLQKMEKAGCLSFLWEKALLWQDTDRFRQIKESGTQPDVSWQTSVQFTAR